MKLNIFKGKRYINDIQEEWNIKGKKYASEINDMVAFGEKYGWENWKGKEPEDKRNHLADEVVKLLRIANAENTVKEFREKFPPGYAPFFKYFEEKGQIIEQIYFIDNEKIIFLLGTSYQKRQAYLLNSEELIMLDSTIDAIGKSKQGNIFGILAENKITTTNGWQGDIIQEFELLKIKDVGITQLIPFNDGLKVLLISSKGIYLINKTSENMIHPVSDIQNYQWNSKIDMENATLSNNNEYIVVGDQDSDHRILDNEGNLLGEIGPQSSYPHFCLFSKDDSQLITNSCHFYNGMTIGVSTYGLKGLKVEAYEERDQLKNLWIKNRK